MAASYRHPARETGISCQRCERPICPDSKREAAVGFQCPECVAAGAKQTRQGMALYGGRRSADPRLTTFGIIALNVLVWLAITATGGRGSQLVDRLALVPLGKCRSLADGSMFYPNATEATCVVGTRGDGVWMPGTADGAWWQVITSAFTHVEIWHIASNMLALFILGPVLEQIMGRARFVAIYLAGALGGSVACLWLSDPSGSTVGASGAIFGLLGALLVSFRKARLDTSGIVQNIGLGVLITVVGWQYISWQGHLGGFIGGAIAAGIVAHAPRANRSLVQWVGLGLFGVVLVGLALARATTLTG